jgi:hypothetical protein
MLIHDQRQDGLATARWLEAELLHEQSCSQGQDSIATVRWLEAELLQQQGC